MSEVSDYMVNLPDTTDERADFRAKILATGVTNVSAEYSGYGDSGQIESCSVELEDFHEFLWTLAYDQNPGFENNDGGQGTIYWDLETDEIKINHGNNYTATDYSEHTL